ncbi:PAB-dependent poly(A)-specific ribonuclease subunit 3 [Kappamyces sp. JEL0829]|nr:PAB-dependent poly(A)-specific ribonuclease subunit 3 [Kappamyces sp. JEL0829]
MPDSAVYPPSSQFDQMYFDASVNSPTFPANNMHMGYPSSFSPPGMGMDGLSLTPQLGKGGKYHQNPMLDNYFFSQPAFGPTTYQPLQHHLYSPPAPAVSNFNAQQKTSHWFFMSEKIRQELVDRNECVHRILDPNGPEAQSLPSEVHVYHTLYPLPSSVDRVSKVFGLPTTLYKGIRSLDGKPYLLRRMENYRLGNDLAISSIDAWTKVRHPGIVSVREGFTTKAFGDISLVMVYDFHPLAITIQEKYLSRPESSGFNNIRSDVLWSFICQLTSAIKTIHAANLAARAIDASKILLTGQNRYLQPAHVDSDLTAAGSLIFCYDLIHFGKLILQLACGLHKPPTDYLKSLEHIGKVYSPEMRDLVAFLLSKPSPTKSIDQIVGLVAPRLLLDFNASLM